jgi:hypothetical protein
VMARRYHRRQEAFVIAKIVILARDIKVVFVNVNLITQNVLNVSHKLAHHDVDTTMSALQTLTADTICCVCGPAISILQSPQQENVPDLETRGH